MSVPPPGSGHSALQPEPASRLGQSASVPNAMRDLSDSINRYVQIFIPATREQNGFSENGIARKVLVGISLALIDAAAAAEARDNATRQGDAQ